MIEGRSGGSGRGTRRESWAPPDSGSAHRRIAGLYRVPDSRPEAVPCAALAFPSLRRFLTLAPACWPRGKIPPHPSARSARHSSPQNGGPKGKMIEGTSLFAKDYPAFLSTMPQGVSEHAAAFLPFTFSTSI